MAKKEYIEYEDGRRVLLGEDDAPELTDAILAKALPASEFFTAEEFASLTKRKPGQRGRQKAPTKEQVTLRLDPDILEHYKATGSGWQSRINDALRSTIHP